MKSGPAQTPNARLAAVMQALNMTDGKIATRVGVQRTYLVRLRRGRGGVGVRLAQGMEREFGVRAEWLLHGELPVFVAEEPGSGIADAVLARVNNPSDPKGVLVFEGAGDISIDAVERAAPGEQELWRAAVQYSWRPHTPALATRHASFYLWPDAGEAKFLKCSPLDLVLFVVPSAFLHPRYARVGDRIICIAEAGKTRTLAEATLVDVHKDGAGTERRKRATTKAAGKHFQIAHRGEFQSTSYDYVLDCRSQRKLSGRVKILGVALRLERGLIKSADAVVEK